MNTKIIFTRNSPVRTVLINEATGQVLYKIVTRRRFVGSVTRVFRCDPATPSGSNPISELRLDVNEPQEDSSPDEWDPLAGVKPEDSGEGARDEVEDGTDGAEVEPLGDDSPLVENEIARWYWKWFSTPRLVFEGKISSRAEYMPLKTRVGRSYVFNHKDVSYRWSLPMDDLRRPKLTIDGTETLIANFRPNSFKKGRAYLEVTPDGMAMLDHIIVTFIPVEVQRRKAG